MTGGFWKTRVWSTSSEAAGHLRILRDASLQQLPSDRDQLDNTNPDPMMFRVRFALESPKMGNKVGPEPIVINGVKPPLQTAENR